MTVSELQVLLCKYALELKLQIMTDLGGRVYVMLPETLPVVMREEADKNFLKGMGIQA